MVVVVTSGGFDPIHPGHVHYLKHVKHDLKANIHICVVNNDEFLMRKKGYVVQPQKSRGEIVLSLKGVDFVWYSRDEDDTVCKSLRSIRKQFPFADIIFCKGGDRLKDEIPEVEVCNELGIEIVDGCGGYVKTTSSQEIMGRFKR